MRLDVCVDVCTDMRTEMCTGMRADMFRHRRHRQRAGLDAAPQAARIDDVIGRQGPIAVLASHIDLSCMDMRMDMPQTGVWAWVKAWM